MDSTESYRFFLPSFLVLLFLGDLTDACRCMELKLQDACENAKIVMRAKFMSVMPDPESRPTSPQNIYTIQPIEAYKGPRELRTQSLYTPASSNFCGYTHKGPLKGEEYLFSGSISGNHFIISLCSFAKPWDQVTSEQKKILKDGGYKGCSVS